MLLGVPVAVVAVGVAFSRGTGMVMACLAFVIVSLQVLLLSLSLGFQFGPVAPLLAILGLIALGGCGVYRLGNPVADFGSPFAEFSPPAALPSPTSRPVDVQNVIGRWQFYCDATCRTVVLQFRDDGTYAQTVMVNHGDIIHYPGGAWRLEGANVEVTDYVAAGEETGRPMTWPMVDTPAGLRLLGGDPGAFFVMTR